MSELAAAQPPGGLDQAVTELESSIKQLFAPPGPAMMRFPKCGVQHKVQAAPTALPAASRHGDQRVSVPTARSPQPSLPAPACEPPPEATCAP